MSPFSTLDGGPNILVAVTPQAPSLPPNCSRSVDSAIEAFSTAVHDLISTLDGGPNIPVVVTPQAPSLPPNHGRSVDSAIERWFAPTRS
jgi:hypothetical protein